MPDARLDLRRCATAPPLTPAARARPLVAVAAIVAALIVVRGDPAALPAGAALLVGARALARGSRTAVHLAAALLLAAGAVGIHRGDHDTGGLALVAAAALFAVRGAFPAVPEPRALGHALRRRLPVAATALAGAAVIAALTGAATPGAAPRTGLDLLLGTGPLLGLPDALAWVPGGLHLLGLAAGAAALAALLLPSRPAGGGAGELDRAAAAQVARRHGCGTLGAFTLRRDVARAWSADGRAFVAYRVAAGTLLLSGDPVGAPDAHGGALDAAIAYAERHGLVLGGVAAGDDFGRLARTRGLRRLYIGDEAMVACGPMDLSGGARKSLRKAVGRIERHGYTAALHRVDELDDAALAALERVSAAWRDGTSERGFSMGHDRLRDELLPDALVVIARDADDAVRGFLHFVPVFGRPQVSLAFMRRERDTPNGLGDFLVVRAAALLGEAGIDELSLNFAPFGGLRREPRNAAERAAVRVLLAIDRWFSLGGLEHFNAKFGPRWEPRRLLFATPAALPRVLLAAMLCEGLLPDRT